MGRKKLWWEERDETGLVGFQDCRRRGEEKGERQGTGGRGEFLRLLIQEVMMVFAAYN